MRPIQSLEAKLDAYKALSADDGVAVKHRKRTWPAFAAAAGSGLAMASSAEAEIIHGNVNLTASVKPYNSGAGPQVTSAHFSFPIDGVNVEFQVAHYLTGSFENGAANIAGHGAKILNVPGSSFGTNRAPLRYLASGAKISGGATGVFRSNATIRHKTSTNARGSFPAGQLGFAGISINKPDGVHFGWIQLSWNKTANSYPTSVTAIDWAYDTVAGESINAGQTTANATVPEPTSAAMLLMASGAIGVLAWRNRKRQMAAAVTSA